MLSSYLPLLRVCTYCNTVTFYAVDPYAELCGTRDFFSLLEFVGRHIIISFLRGQLMVMEDDNRRQLPENHCRKTNHEDDYLVTALSTQVADKSDASFLRTHNPHILDDPPREMFWWFGRATRRRDKREN